MRGNERGPSPYGQTARREYLWDVHTDADVVKLVAVRFILLSGFCRFLNQNVLSFPLKIPTLLRFSPSACVLLPPLPPGFRGAGSLVPQRERADPGVAQGESPRPNPPKPSRKGVPLAHSFIQQAFVPSRRLSVPGTPIRASLAGALSSPYGR